MSKAAILTSLTPPAGPPSLVASWQIFMNAALQFVGAIEHQVPEGKNRDEAVERALKAAMVASGAFHLER